MMGQTLISISCSRPTEWLVENPRLRAVANGTSHWSARTDWSLTAGSTVPWLAPPVLLQGPTSDDDINFSAARNDIASDVGEHQSVSQSVMLNICAVGSAGNRPASYELVRVIKYRTEYV